MSFTLSEVGRLSGASVIVFVRRFVDPERHAQGWRQTDVPHLDVRLIPGVGGRRFCLAMVRKYAGATHIMAGAFWDATLLYCLVCCCYRGLTVYLMTEPFSPIAAGYQKDSRWYIGLLKHLGRPILYRLWIKLLRSRLTGVFAISRLAQDQYQRMGVPVSKIFPFGYFVPCAGDPTDCLGRHLSVEDTSDQEFVLRLVFVGSLIHRKGVDLAIDAVRSVNRGNPLVLMDFYGPGDSTKFEFDGNTAIYKSTIPFGCSQKVIARYDALVLPSRYDGWGVVVNEALCAGTPVICSSKAGAAELVERFSAGVVFDPRGASSLARAFRILLDEPTQLCFMRARARTAIDEISPTVAAEYLLKILKGQVDAGTARSVWLNQRRP